MKTHMFCAVVLFTILTECLLAQTSQFMTREKANIIVKGHQVVTPQNATFLHKRKQEIPIIPSNRKFSPPVHKYDPSYSCISLSAESNSVVYFPEGYIVKIPAGTLINSEGHTATGEYSLYLRDLTDMTVMMLAGAPMNYDSGGVMNVFQTAGMFELYAEQNGEALSIREGAEVNVEVPTPDVSSGFNLYYYNENSGQWEFSEPMQNPLSGTSNTDAPTIYSEAWRYTHLLTSKKIDSTNFENRWLSIAYGRNQYLGDFSEISINSPSFYYHRNYYFRIRRMFSTKNPKLILFNLPYIADSYRTIFYKQFPELTGLNRVVWQYCGDLSKKQFYEKYIKKRRYTDMRIVNTHKGEKFTIILKYVNGFEQFEAVLYRGKQTFGEIATKRNAMFYHRYQKRLDKIAEKFDRELNKTIAKGEATYVSNKGRLKGMMSDEELAMTMDEWLEYARNIASFFYLSMNNEGMLNVTRSLNVNRFGMINVDKIYRWADPVEMIAKFETEEGEKLGHGRIYIINYSSNTYLSIPMTNSESFARVSKRSNTVFCIVNLDSEMFVVNASDIKEAANSQKGKTLIAYPVDDNPMHSITLASKL